MAVNQDTVIKIALSENDLSSCIDNTQILCETISDRSDLHLRSYMERYIDIMMGEVAEAAVIKWLKQNGKYAVSAVNKSSGKPDSGRDIILRGKHKQEIECSVKSSLSVYKDNINDILDTFTIATKASELRKSKYSSILLVKAKRRKQNNCSVK